MTGRRPASGPQVLADHLSPGADLRPADVGYLDASPLVAAEHAHVTAALPKTSDDMDTERPSPAGDEHRTLALSSGSMCGLPPCFRHLPGGDVEPVEDVGHGNHHNQRREPLLVVAPSRLVPGPVGDRVCSVAEAGHGPRCPQTRILWTRSQW